MPAEEQMKKAREEISRTIKIALVQRGMTQAELADMLHESRQTVNLAVKGGSDNYLVKIREKIYKILGIEP